MTVSRAHPVFGQGVVRPDLAGFAGHKAQDPVADPKTHMHLRETQLALQEIEEFLGGFDRRLEFRVDDESQRVIVRILDRGTGEVIRQVPPEQLLHIIASVNRLLGMLFDRRV